MLRTKVPLRQWRAIATYARAADDVRYCAVQQCWPGTVSSPPLAPPAEPRFRGLRQAQHQPRYSGKATTGGRHDHCSLRSCSRHHGCREPLFRLAKQGISKILAGAFFVSSGILFYLYLTDVSVPLLGTSFVETPQISGGRSIVHFILSLLCFYFGFVRTPKA